MSGASSTPAERVLDALEVAGMARTVSTRPSWLPGSAGTQHAVFSTTYEDLLLIASGTPAPVA